MKKSLALTLIAFFITIAFFGCDLNKIIGSGVIVTVEKDFTDFSRLDISYAFECDITRSDSYSTVLRVDDNIVEYLNVIKEGDTLKIYLDPNYTYEDVTLEADITMPDLEAVDLSGASEAVVTGFDFEHIFEVELSGASSVTGSMNLGMVKFDLSGASEITLEGYGGDLDIDASGASILNLADLISDNANVTLSGASEATINITGTLNYYLSGASMLYYYGNPNIGDNELSDASAAEDLGNR